MSWKPPLETVYPPFEDRPSPRTRLAVVGALLRMVYKTVNDWRDALVLERVRDPRH